MRLINVDTLLLEEFYSDIPRYAILSHCWGEGEVTFSDWQNPFGSATKKKGYVKIRRACDEARSQSCSYLWCDTNCIDKSSSAELSEAINSMFEWYRLSAVCLAYLEDVLAPGLQDQQDHRHAESRSSFCASRWFTRGWTLQELLAPDEVQFYGGDWQFIGSRSMLADLVAQATGIPTTFLRLPPPSNDLLDTSGEIRNRLDKASIAMRMSWLSRRRTTRAEDMAYCMFGIFDINMPLLYGEGTKAFRRLQEEIVRVSNDMTIFCWHWDDTHVPDNWASILAPSPSVFRDSGGYTEILEPQIGETTPYSITNAGLSVKLPAVSAGRHVLAFLRVSHSDYTVLGRRGTRFALPLLGPHRLAPDVYVRSRLPPLAAPAGDTLPQLAVDHLDRWAMYIPLRQGQLRSRLVLVETDGLLRPEELRLPRTDLDFEGGVFVVLTSSLHAGLDTTLAPKNLLALKEVKGCSGWCIGVLPIHSQPHDITIWIGFAAMHVALRKGRQAKGWSCTVLGFTTCEAKNRSQNLGVYEKKMVNWLDAHSLYNENDLAGVGSLADVPIKVQAALGQSVSVNNTCELAVAHVTIHWKEQDEAVQDPHLTILPADHPTQGQGDVGLGGSDPRYTLMHRPRTL